MKITAEEKLMYQIMKEIYASSIPISFKGSMVLKACLMEAGYQEDTRHTVDIDANWNSDAPPTPDQMVKSLQKAIDKSGTGLKVSLYRMYGEGRSAGFEIADPVTTKSCSQWISTSTAPKFPRSYMRSRDFVSEAYHLCK